VSEVNQKVTTTLTLDDRITGALGKVVQGAQKANSAFNSITTHLTAMIPLAGGLGAALSLKGIMDTTDEYLSKIKEVKNLTGASAAATDFMFSSARKAGVEYDDMQKIMFGLSRRASMLEQTMAMSNGKHLPGMAKKMAHLGVDISKGPIQAMLSMGKAVRSGKLGADDLMATFRVPPKAVNDFKEFVGGLGTADDLKKKIGAGAYVQDSDIDAFEEMESAQHRIRDAFNRIQVMVGLNLIPVLAKLTDQVAGKIEEWLPAAEAFGEFLADNFDRLLGAAKAIMAVFAAKKVLNIVMAVPGISGVLAGMGEKIMQTFGAGLFAGMGPIGAAFGTLKLALVAFGPVLAVVTLAVLALAAVWRGITKNIEGVGDRFHEVVDEIIARFQIMGDAIASMFGGDGGFGALLSDIADWVGMIAASGINAVLTLFSATLLVIQASLATISEIGDPFKFVAVHLYEFVKQWTTKVFDPLMELVKTLGMMIFDAMRGNVAGVLLGAKEAFEIADAYRVAGPKLDIGGEIVNALGTYGDAFTANMYKFEQAAQKRASENKLAKIPTKRGEDLLGKAQSNNFDFSGSKFDIKQNFAEGFDPDRIAVAFASDLAALGETKVSSGFSPLYAVR